MANTTIAPRAASYFSPLAFAVGAACYALLIVAALAAASHDAADPLHVLAQCRAQRTAQATLILLAATVCFYLLWYRGGVFKSFWLAFWTFSYFAYLTHLLFAIFGVFHGDVIAVFHHMDLVTHPVFDTILTLWWGIDVLLALTSSPEAEDTLIRFGRSVAHMVFPVAFFFATHEDKATYQGHLVGDVAVVVILGGVIFWASVRRPVVVSN